MLNTRLFDWEKASNAAGAYPESELKPKAHWPDIIWHGPAGWLKVMQGEFVAQAKTIGVNNFVYRARRPFHPQRLWDLIEQDTFDGVLRSKGFFWLSTFNNTIGEWSQAGDILNFNPQGPWFATMPEADWPVEDGMKPKIKKDFDVGEPERVGAW